MVAGFRDAQSPIHVIAYSSLTWKCRLQYGLESKPSAENNVVGRLYGGTEVLSDQVHLCPTFSSVLASMTDRLASSCKSVGSLHRTSGLLKSHSLNMTRTMCQSYAYV